VSSDLLFEYLQIIKEDEKFKTSDDVLHLIARSSEGSTRRALTFLSQCSDITNVREAVDIIKSIDENEEGAVGDLLKALVSGITWERAVDILKELGTTDPESTRRAILAYMTKIALGTKDKGKAERVCAIISAFKDPYPNAAGSQYPLLLSIGELCLGS